MDRVAQLLYNVNCEYQAFELLSVGIAAKAREICRFYWLLGRQGDHQAGTPYWVDGMPRLLNTGHLYNIVPSSNTRFGNKYSTG